jgi:hypothetical protein
MHTHNWQTNNTTGFAECSCGRTAVGVPMTNEAAALARASFLALVAVAK